LIFLRVRFIEDKQVLLFNFVFDLLWTGWGPSVCSVALLRNGELKYFEKHGCRESRCTRGNALTATPSLLKLMQICGLIS